MNLRLVLLSRCFTLLFITKKKKPNTHTEEQEHETIIKGGGLCLLATLRQNCSQSRSINVRTPYATIKGIYRSKTSPGTAKQSAQLEIL